MSYIEPPTVAPDPDGPLYRLHVRSAGKLGAWWAIILKHGDDENPVWVNVCDTSDEERRSDMHDEALTSGLQALRELYA